MKASNLGLGFLVLSSNILLLVYFCKKTNKIIKIKALSLYLKNNRVYFFKLFVIVSILRPELLRLLFFYLKYFLRSFFYLFYYVGNKKKSFTLIGRSPIIISLWEINDAKHNYALHQ